MGARDENRERMQEAILDAGRRQLAEVGPVGLSLRAVARDLGVASSAVYRYVESRDELLTRLIVAAYDDLGTAVEAVEAAARRDDLGGRWRAAAGALRGWAREHPNEWALVYGSPVPGYAAPEDTIAPAARVPLVLVAIVRDAKPRTDAVLPPAVAQQAARVAGSLGLDAPPAVMARLVAAWTQLVGTVSLELFGHLAGSVDPADDYWAWLVEDLGRTVGIPPR